MKKFHGSITINKPIDDVVKLFLDSEHIGKYQDGFIKKELKSGQSGEEGSISTLYYKYGKNDMILEETIVDNDLPGHFEAFYHHKHMDNTMTCAFVSLDEQTTRYDYEYVYTRINWLIPRLMFILFPGMYKKQGDKWNRQFKEFVESLD